MMGMFSRLGAGAMMGAGAPASAAPSPAFPASADTHLRTAGITTSSGDVATWDDEGSAALRFEGATTELRPEAVAVGALTGAKCGVGGDYLVSTATAQIVKPTIVWLCLRQDVWVSARRLLDFDTSAYLAYAGSTGLYRWEHGATDPTTTTVVADGDIIQITVKVAATGGTSAIYLNGVSEGTAAATATAPAARTVGLGATNGGVNSAQATILEAGVWQFADNAAMEAFDLDALHTYGAYVIAQAGG